MSAMKEDPEALDSSPLSGFPGAVDPPAACTDCGGEWELGFVPDHNHYGTAEAFWTPGEPKRTWIGLKFSSVQRYYLKALRCQSCGVLRFYAHKRNWRPVE